jgi:alkanesulfonate monooxygenase SsuD/methylene tetrahydromethanopterin reductase-like flavin-dependent oxidoreductase (luciferase family)
MEMSGVRARSKRYRVLIDMIGGARGTGGRRARSARRSPPGGDGSNRSRRRAPAVRRPRWLGKLAIMRLGVCVLPEYSWREAAAIWSRVEQMGAAAAWTYDHITWYGLPTGPWYGAWPTLTAAAATTSGLRLGTLVASPNFRHPVPFAQEIMTLDDISGGRLTVGLGAGVAQGDATVLGGEGWPAAERADRFEEFVEILDAMLTGAPLGRPHTTYKGRYYSALDARLEPGCVQAPRTPFAIAATGPRGMALAAKHAQQWVCLDMVRGDVGREEQFAAVGRLVRRLDEACERAGRDPGSLERLILTGFGADRPLESVAAFEDSRGRYTRLGFSELIVHYPRPQAPFAAPMGVLETVAAL